MNYVNIWNDSYSHACAIPHWSKFVVTAGDSDEYGCRQEHRLH